MKLEPFIIYFYLPMMVWILLIVILFAVLVKKYTLGNWTKDDPNPYAKETLGLPRGIFRAVLTLSLLFGVIVFELANMALNNSESQVSEYLVAFQMMIAFYFGSKVMHHVASNDRKKNYDRAHQAVEVAKVSGVVYSNSSSPQSQPDTKNDSGSDFYDPESAG